MLGGRRRQQHTRRLLVWVACVRVVWAVLPFGVQSNDGDVASTFASSMVYDPLIDRLYITGSSYGGYFDSQYSYQTKLGNRDCFLASLQLPTATDRRGPIWLLKESYGNKNASEACSDVLLHRRDNARAYYLAAHSVGSAGLADMLSIEQNSTDNDTRIYGLVMDTSIAGHLEGGIIFRSGAVHIPLSIAALDGTDNVIVASITASEDFANLQYSKWMEDQHTLQPDPDIRAALLSSTQNFAFETTLRRLTSTRKNSNDINEASQALPSLEPLWETSLTSTNQTQSFISGIYVGPNGTLLVAGYTASTVHGDGLFYNGFVRRVDAESGNEIRSVRLQAHNESIHERALAICGDGSSHFLFVVGTYEVSASTSAFLMKLNTETLETIWHRELSAVLTAGSLQSTSQALGLGCAVDRQGTRVFWAGTVKDGATLSVTKAMSISNSSGGDDIFVAKVDARGGEILWINQMGTQNDDTLATGRGIVSDREGNAIILANTRGSFMRKKSELGKRITNDIVVFSINGEDGSHLPILDTTSLPETSPQQAEEGSESVKQDTKAHGRNSTSSYSSDQLRPPADNVAWSYPTASPSVKMDDDYSSSKGFILVAIAVVTSLLLCSFCGLVLLRRRTKTGPPSCGATDHPDENCMRSSLVYCGREQFLCDTRRGFAHSDTLLRSSHHKELGSRLVVEPDVVNYSSQKPDQLEIDIRQEPRIVSLSKSNDATEAEVMRLLKEWKRQRGHPMDPSGECF